MSEARLYEHVSTAWETLQIEARKQLLSSGIEVPFEGEAGVVADGVTGAGFYFIRTAPGDRPLEMILRIDRQRQGKRYTHPATTILRFALDQTKIYQGVVLPQDRARICFSEGVVENNGRISFEMCNVTPRDFAAAAIRAVLEDANDGPHLRSGHAGIYVEDSVDGILDGRESRISLARYELFADLIQSVHFYHPRRKPVRWTAHETAPVALEGFINPTWADAPPVRPGPTDSRPRLELVVSNDAPAPR